MVSGQVPVRQTFVHDTWAVRDLPVLDATVALLEQSYMVTVTDIAAATGLDAAVVARALETLDPVYVDFRKTTTGGDPRFWYVFKVTPEARRAVGQWPTAEALAGRLAAELAAAAQHETDGERQGLLAYAARLVGDTLRAATVRAAGEVLAPAFGGVPKPELGFPVPQPEPEPEQDIPSLVELPELLRPDRPAADQAAADQSVPGQDAAGPAAAGLPAPAGASSREDDEPGPTWFGADRDENAAGLGWPADETGTGETGTRETGTRETGTGSHGLAPLPDRPETDPDGRDTDLDLVQSREDAARAV
jgi:predicted transcriptional regulator